MPDSIDEFTITYSKVFLGINVGLHLLPRRKQSPREGQSLPYQQEAFRVLPAGGFLRKDAQIMNWENGFRQIRSTRSMTSSTRLRHKRRKHRTRAPHRRTEHPGIPPDRRTPPDRESNRAMNWRACSPPTINFPGHQRTASGRTDGLRHRRARRRIRSHALLPKHPLPSAWTVQPSNPYLLDALAKDFQNTTSASSTLSARS